MVSFIWKVIILYDEIKNMQKNKGADVIMELSDGMLLYHGSYCEVRTPDLNKCASSKDFAKSFIESEQIWKN